MSRSFVLFLMAVALGGGAAMMAKNWAERQAAPVEVAEVKTIQTTPVVVAAMEIPFGHKVERAQLKVVSWPAENVPPKSFSSLEALDGKIAKQKIFAGEVLHMDRLVDQGAGSTLSAVIPPEKRAVTVRVNDVIGVAGFLLPGNRVDVLASRKAGNSNSTSTLLKDIKVLAVDQTSDPDNEKPIVVRAVTLEVGPQEAEKLVQATQEGSVQLALRNPQSTAEVEKPEPKPQRSAYSSVTVIRGTQASSARVRM
jgi:pilus assembly protein CpaB